MVFFGFFDINLFFLLSICSFGSRPYARKKWAAIQALALSTLPSKSMPTLSREASAPVGLALTFGSAQS
jgi:hypothetical protein